MAPLPAFDIHADAGRARTLPPAFYLDESAFAAVRERVFARGWQWIGTLGDVADPLALAAE